MDSLTPCQETALHEFKKFMVSNRQQFILSGGAGNGKTYIVKKFLEELPTLNSIKSLTGGEVDNTIAFVAPTNAAARVLSKALDGKKVTTIHKLFGLIRSYTKSGKLVFNQSKHFNMVLKLNLLVVDEASMVSRSIMDIILNSIDKNTKILWVGDSYQLPPVGESNSIVFNSGITEVELKTPVRFDSSTISKAVLACRQAVIYEEYPELESGEGIVILPKDEFRNEIIKHEGNESSFTLAWTNAKVNSYNKLITDMVYDGDPTSIGQRVISKDRSDTLEKDTVYEITNKTDTRIELLNEDNELVEADTKVITLNKGIEVYLYSNGVKKILTPILKKLKKERKWNEYYAMKEEYVTLSNSAAITVHKSQGRTYDTVFIDIEDIFRNRNINETLRLLYVAISRAKKQIYILG